MTQREGVTRRGIPRNPTLRRLAAVNLATTVALGVKMTLVVIYFTTVIGLPITQVAFAMSAAALVALLLSTPFGILADRLDPVVALRAAYLAGAVVTVGLVFATNIWLLAVTLIADRAIGAFAGNVRNMYLARVCAADGESRVAFMAYLRAVANVGISVGALAGAIPLTIGVPWVYQATFALNAAFLVLSALIAGTLPPMPAAPDADEIARHHAEEVGERRRVWRDHPFVLVILLQSVFALHFVVAEVAYPLWVVQDTESPDWMVSAMLLTQTVFVALFQVRMSRGSGTVAEAARAFLPASVLAAAGFMLIAFASLPGAVIAGILLVVGAGAHVFGEMIGSGAQWGVEFGLAPTERQGEYQGFVGAALSATDVVGPVLVAFLCVDNGIAGWVVMSAIIVGAAIAIRPASRWALATRARYGVVTHTG